MIFNGVSIPLKCWLQCLSLSTLWNVLVFKRHNSKGTVHYRRAGTVDSLEGVTLLWSHMWSVSIGKLQYKLFIFQFIGIYSIPVELLAVGIKNVRQPCNRFM